jgi:hypothetical protein
MYKPTNGVKFWRWVVTFRIFYFVDFTKATSLR